MPAWSGLYDNVFTGGHSLTVNKNNARTMMRNLINRVGMRKERALLDALIGAAAGGTATASRVRVEAVAGGENLGGMRNVETVSLINRATTAADVTDLENFLVDGTVKPTYVADKSGNGAR